MTDQRRPLPESWEWTTIGEVASIQSGAGFPKKYQGQSIGDLPFAKVGDISNAVRENSSILDRANNYISTKEAQELRAKIFPPGSTVFAKIGEAVRLNRRAIVKTSLLVDNNVMGLIPEPTTLDSRRFLILKANRKVRSIPLESTAK